MQGSRASVFVFAQDRARYCSRTLGYPQVLPIWKNTHLKFDAAGARINGNVRPPPINSRRCGQHYFFKDTVVSRNKATPDIAAVILQDLNQVPLSRYRCSTYR
jgi:hypothetical protein